MSAPDFLERLILEIEKYPVIYNKGIEEYKDPDRKYDAWKKIADKLSIGVPLARTKWKNLRDCMRRYKDSIRTKSGQASKKVKEYKYARILGYLEPFWDDRRSSGNLHATPQEDQSEQQQTLDVSDDDQDGTLVPEASGSGKTSDIMPAKKKKNTPAAESLPSTDAVFVNYIKKKTEKMDKKPADDTEDVTHFMKSMTSKTIKFSPCARSDLMFKIHELVHQVEMHEMYNARSSVNKNPSTCNVQNQPSMGQLRSPAGVGATCEQSYGQQFMSNSWTNL